MASILEEFEDEPQQRPAKRSVLDEFEDEASGVGELSLSFTPSPAPPPPDPQVAEILKAPPTAPAPGEQHGVLGRAEDYLRAKVERDRFKSAMRAPALPQMAGDNSTVLE